MILFFFFSFFFFLIEMRDLIEMGERDNKGGFFLLLIQIEEIMEEPKIMLPENKVNSGLFC
jgi:hypothetical protein